MKNVLLTSTFLWLFWLISCKSNKLNASKEFTSITIDTLFTSKINIRAIAIDNDTIFYGGSDKKIGFVTSKTKLEKQIASISRNFEFRSIALTSKYVYFLSIENPALLYRYSKNLEQNELVYEENHEKAFYDSMQFWNSEEGIAIGDPTENCLSIITTRDSGKTWTKIPCDKLPKIVDGEAAFAASNTNIVVKGTNTWIVTGGVKARVLFSSDKGISWQSYDTPIVQGKSMTGIFTADFYDAKQGFIAGGDYEILTHNQGNKAVSVNGGKTWSLRADNSGFGYASCIQYVPKSGGKSLVSVGASGIYYSYDSGLTWKQFSTDASLYTIRFIDNQTAVAAGKDKMIRIKFKRKP